MLVSAQQLLLTRALRDPSGNTAVLELHMDIPVLCLLRPVYTLLITTN